MERPRERPRTETAINHRSTCVKKGAVPRKTLRLQRKLSTADSGVGKEEREL